MTVLLAAVLMGARPAQALSSGEIIAKTLEKYAGTKSGIGEFTMNQTAGSKKVSVKTELQFERPSKIYLHQTSANIAPGDWLLVSDGANFGYDVPGNPSGPRRRLFEQVAVAESATGNKKILKIHSIYMAAKRSLGDNLNPFVEMATATAGDTQSLKGFMTRLTKIGTPTNKDLADGGTAYLIKGIMFFGDRQLDKEGNPMVDKLTGDPIFESAGNFQMTISKDFELLDFKTVEQVNVVDTATNLPTNVNVITTWTGKLQFDAQPAAGIFTVK